MNLIEIVNRLKKIEGTLSSLEAKVLVCANYYKSKVRQRDACNTLIAKGIDGLKEKVLRENKLMLTKKRMIFLNSNLFKKLRNPHRKIVEYLADQYDSVRGEYKEINYSRLVRNSRIGKNKANEYLRFLSDIGLIKKRDDGYRVWFKFSDQSVCGDNSG